MKRIAAMVMAGLLLAACGSGEDGATRPATPGQENGSAAAGGTDHAGEHDPREGELAVALGEWAVTLEAGTIRPGRVTFVVANRGTVGHGFEIEAEAEDDSSGPGSGEERLKAETNLLQPGETTELTLTLGAGVYKVECIVPGHDDLGMEGFLEVRREAPLAEATAAAAGEVSIQNFAFDPAEIRVGAGTEVTWTNRDEAPHTVTADDGSFDSGTLEPGDTFTFAVQGNGPVTYACQIHPEMTGSIVTR